MAGAGTGAATGTGLTYARHALTANAAASVFVCSTLGNECSAPLRSDSVAADFVGKYLATFC